MKVAFLYPGDDPRDALVDWVKTLGRHCARHEVRHVKDAHCRAWADVVFLLTQGAAHPRDLCDRHVRELAAWPKPFGVVHNWDAPGVPTPGDYPSFCWTERQRLNLERYRPTLLRMPVFPPLVPAYAGTGVHVATFGLLEPKKQVAPMARWARAQGVRFTAFGPSGVAPEYDPYVRWLREGGVDVALYTWQDRVEDLAFLFEDVSHFLFALTESKGGTGGCPTSPRYAGFFRRPVVVIDDEGTYQEDGYVTLPSFGGLLLGGRLEAFRPPRYDWSPDAYVEALVRETLAYWGK